jgi:formylglycine-generating enzyme required for sulfatase activity
LQLTLAAGSHQIKANHKGRDSESRTLNLFNGDSKTLSLPLSSNINDLGMNFVQIPAGRFQMGSNETDNERPIHTVNVSAFKMMTTEVTQGQWQAIMGENPSYFDGWIFSNDDHPVERVSWNDAQNFIIKLNQKTGKVYRLPSEAE